MSLKISFWLLLPLVVLLAAVLVQSNEGDYRRFLRKHIKPGAPAIKNLNNYCNRMMKRIGLTRPCRATHTFIHGSPHSFRNICRGQGEGSSATTRRRYPVTVCRLRGKPRRCNYHGRRENKRVRVTCRGRLPVHFEKLV